MQLLALSFWFNPKFATNNKMEFQYHLTWRGYYFCLNGIHSKPVTGSEGL